MAQWVNRLRNKIFVNAPPLPLLCEISGVLHLAQPGLVWQTKGDFNSLNTKRSSLEVHRIQFSVTILGLATHYRES